MAERFPDINERGIIEIFWWGILQPIRTKILEMGINPEHSSLDKMVKYAARAEDGIREMNTQRDNSGRTWGRFDNRMSGPKPYRPSGDDGKSNGEGQERVRANAMTPQPANSSSRPNHRGPNGKQRGRKISRAKRDELRAEGKCFQCERTGHSQRDCPELNTMRPPVVKAGSVGVAHLERFAKARDQADLQVGYMAFASDTEATHGDDATPAMWKAYGQCTEAWGWDVEWLDVKSRVDSRYGIHQYGTDFGEIVEVTNHGQPELGIVEIDATRFDDPDFRIVDMFHVDTNTDRSCIQEGGFRDQQNYKIWEWSTIKWLRKLVDEQTKFENSTEVQCYCAALDEGILSTYRGNKHVLRDNAR